MAYAFHKKQRTGKHGKKCPCYVCDDLKLLYQVSSSIISDSAEEQKNSIENSILGLKSYNNRHTRIWKTSHVS